MRISVIIPVYKVEPYLRRCVDSVLAQSCLLHEIILIDDGSPDGCPAICDEYARTYPELVRVEHQKNQGLSAARNRGIELSTGDLLGFIDSDDYIEPDMFAVLAEMMEKTGADMAAGGVFVEEESGEKYCNFEAGPDRLWTKEEALVELNSFRYLGISTWNKLYKKELFQEIKFPPVLYEDNFVMYQLVARCNYVACTSKPVYHYIQRKGSISRNAGEVSLLPLEAYRQQLEFFKKNYAHILYAAETAYVFAHIAIYNLHVRKGLRCGKSLAAMLRKESRRYLRSVLKNDRLPAVKRMQALVFCISLSAYKVIVERRSHR